MLFGSPLSPFSIVFAFAAALLFMIAWITHRLDNETPVRKWFALLLITDGTWALLSVLPLEAETQQIAFAAESLRVAASGAAALAWFCFAVVYRGYGSNLTRLRLVALTTPLCLHVLAFITNPVHELSIRNLQVSAEGATTLITYGFGPIYSFATAYALLLVFSGAALVIEAAIRDSDLYADQGIALFVGSLMPIIGVLLTLFGATGLGSTNPTPALLTVTAVSYGYAIFRADLLATSPQVAAEGRSIAIESLEQGFLIVDGTDRVIGANEAAKSLLGVDKLRGRSFETVFPSDRTADADIVTFRTADRSVIEARVTSGTGSDDSGVSRVVTLRDVTQQRERQERLDVLQRVLRHNVRNDLTVVQGYARQITSDDSSSVDSETAARRIIDNSQDLVSIAEKVREVDEKLGSASGERESVALPALLKRRIEHIRETAEKQVTIRTDLPEACQISTEAVVLKTVIDEALENAVRHTEQDDPRIDLSVSLGETILIRIADDGPGVPEHERNAVLAGTVTPLEHSTGLGLWTVQWGVRHLNGELSIRDRSPHGTIVEIQLPRHPSKEEPEPVYRDVSYSSVS